MSASRGSRRPLHFSSLAKLAKFEIEGQFFFLGGLWPRMGMPRLTGAVGADPFGFFALGFLSAALAAGAARGDAPSGFTAGLARGVDDIRTRAGRRKRVTQAANSLLFASTATEADQSSLGVFFQMTLGDRPTTHSWTEAWPRTH